jgi:hypothetical protein
MNCTIWRNSCLKLTLAAAFAAVCPLAQADTVTISDPYVGQNSSASGAASQASDVIGSYSEFDIDKLVFTAITPGNVTVQVDFNHAVPGSSNTADLALNPYVFPKATLPVGDLLFDVNGVDTFGVALVAHDGLIAGDLYQITNTYSSDHFLAGSGYYWRFGTPVQMDPNGAQLIGTGAAPVTVGLGGAEVQTTLSFATNAAFWNDLAAAGLSVHFESAVCANDVLDGRVTAPTPEPAQMVLFGTVLVIAMPLLSKKLRRTQI